MLRSIIVLFLFIVVSSTNAQQQYEYPAPQFLYIDDSRLMLVDGYTGETSELPIEVGENDEFEWSTGGKYLIAYIEHEDASEECINLFDVDTFTWVYTEPIACGWVKIRTLSNSDDTQLIYTVPDEVDGVSLYLLNLETNDTTLLFERFSDSQINDVGIENLQWSPTGKYLTANSSLVLMSGSSNSFLVVNMDNLTYTIIYAPDTFYANYHPIWSDDDQWMLLRMKDQWVMSCMTPFSNDEGDVYLANADTGETTRLTYTPTIREEDIAWTDEGNITYTEILYETTTLSLEQAQAVPTLSREEIIEPEPYERDTLISASQQQSPDPETHAYVYRLSEGIEITILSRYRTDYSTRIGNRYPDPIIGWRPSNYDYPQG